jgi:hypothetical protein
MTRREEAGVVQIICEMCEEGRPFTAMNAELKRELPEPTGQELAIVWSAATVAPAKPRKGSHC